MLRFKFCQNVSLLFSCARWAGMFVFCVHWGLAVADDELVLHDHIRGSRYCEILVVNGSMSNLVATVYNTLGVNDCPANQWSAIDPKAQKNGIES